MKPVMEPLPEHFGEGGPRIWDNDKLDEQIQARLSRGHEIVSEKDLDDISYAESRELLKINNEVEALKGQMRKPHIGHPSPRGSRFGDAFRSRMDAFAAARDERAALAR
jgi:hypothetical protein